jgi:hypothetical protein
MREEVTRRVSEEVPRKNEPPATVRQHASVTFLCLPCETVLLGKLRPASLPDATGFLGATPSAIAVAVDRALR